MDTTIMIDGKEVKFRATARTPRLYRVLTGRDMIKDMNELAKSFKRVQNKDENSVDQLGVKDLIIFEDAAFVMAKHAVPDIEAKTSDEWLDGFQIFSIYEILPEILKLWALNNKTTSEAKKN